MHLATVQFLPDVYLSGGHSLLHTHKHAHECVGRDRWGVSGESKYFFLTIHMCVVALSNL